MRIPLSLLTCWLLVPAASAATRTVLVDFNNVSSADQTANPSGGLTYNNATLPSGQSTNGAVLINGNASLALIDTDANSTPWTLSGTKGGGGGIGASGTGANYNGPYPAEVAVFAASALKDGAYANNSATLRLTISGLDPAKTYELLTYGGRGNSGTVQPYTLAEGSSSSAPAVSFSPLNNSSIAPAWASITPTAGGVIGLEISAVGTGSTVQSINFLRLVENDTPPDPGDHSAAAIHLALHGTQATTTAMDPANAPLTQGSRVDTSTTNWNSVTSSTPQGAHSIPATPLLAADGLTSGASVSGSAGYTDSNANGYDTATKDHVMMAGWFGLRATESLTISGLHPDLAADYHVIVYGDSNDTNRSMSYTLGGVTKTISDTGTFNGTFTPGSNHVVFTGLSGTSLTLTGNPGGSSPRSAVSGISIVPGQPFGIESFTASPHYVTPGSPATLSWTLTQPADSIEIEPGIGAVTGNSVQVTPNETTTYTLTATRGGASATATVRIGVGPVRPNILFFLVDDMGWQDCSLPFHFPNGTETRTALNNTYRTPNLESLAGQGMRFTNACAHPVCSPSRVTLMTGMHPARHRVTNWTHPTYPQQTDNANGTLNPPPDWVVGGMSGTEPTMPGLLQAAGYRTIHAGKAHFGPNFRDAAQTIPGASGNPLNLGFDVNIAGHGAGGPGSYASENSYGTAALWHVPGLEKYYTPTQTHTHLTEALTLEVNKSITDAVGDGTPFFAYMSHYAIHAPYETDARFSANYPSLSGTRLGHATLIEGMDKSLGDILAKIRQLGVAENTLVIFMGDNGAESPNTSTLPNPSAPLRGRKGTAYEGGTRVPFVVAWAQPNPANPLQQALAIAPNSRRDELISIEDIFDTVLDVAKVSHTVENDGTSLVPYFIGEPGEHRPQEFITHFPHAHNDNFYSTLRQGNWKIIHRYLNRSWELYDLSTDIGETNNLATNPTAGNAERLMVMARRLASELHRMGAQFPTEDATGNTRGILTPNLTSVDSDNDGVPDVNEDPNRNGLVDTGETNPDARDTDGDGTIDGAEARVGTNPLDPSSSFAASLELLADNLRLSWPSLPGATFAIHSSGDLADWSHVVVSGLPAAAEPARSTSYQMEVPAPDKRFFRVRLEEP